MTPPWLKTTARVGLAIGGGYLASASVLVLLCMMLAALGMPRAEAATLGMLLVFVVYLCFLLWVFASATLWRPFVVFFLLTVSGYGLTAFMGHGH